MKDISHEPKVHRWLGNTYQTLLDRDEADGHLSIFDGNCPAGEGPPRHIHDDADESFVVLSGEVHFWLEGRVFTRGPGQSAFVPRGAEHTYRVGEREAARMMVVMTPGGFDRFFAEMAEGGYTIPADMEAINRIAAQHRLRFTGPPLTAEEVA